MSHSSPLYDARIEAGMCVKCGKLSGGKYHCNRCAAKESKRNMERYIRKNPVPRRSRGKRACSICGKQGHFAPRCGSPKRGP